MKEIITTVILLCCISLEAIYAQDKHPVFIGIQPAITVEPFYEEGELDVNVFPLLIETPIGSRVTIKLSPLLNYHIGGEENGISDVGLYVVFPVYIKKRETKSDLPYGFYVGPVLGFGRNLLNEHYTTTLAVEPGYFFKANKSFTVSLGLQFGGSYFSYDDNSSKWIFHWGPKIGLGFWVNKPEK